MKPFIKKFPFISGLNLNFRDVNLNDSEFLLSLRTNPKKNTYISETSTNLNDQINWINNYILSNNQAYFIISDKNNNKIGCIRMYDPDENSYSWGSWIMIDGLNPLFSLESAIFIYSLGNFLGFKQAKLNVRKDNKFVCNFHEKVFSAKIYKKTMLDNFYLVDTECIDKVLHKYSNLIPKGLRF